MKKLMVALLTVIALCLFKLAFFQGASAELQLIPQAHAEGGIVEWKGSSRLVTSSSDGAITYVWDYDAKTKVRKYYIEGEALKMKIYSLE